MKTLDEVIHGYECCLAINCAECPYANWNNTDVVRCDPTDKDDDALHYLKEYRDRKETLRNWSEKAISEQQNFADAYMFYKSKNEKDNNPLTWEELESMEGKPVWVEDNIDEPEDTTKYWAIYRRIEKTQETEYALLSDFYYDKAQYGESWKAYRKER